MNARRKAVRWMAIVCGTACLTVLGGCSQPKIVRETVVVVATATSLAPATIQPAAATLTSTPQTSVSVQPEAIQATVATRAAPTPAPTETPAQPTSMPTAQPTAQPTSEPTVEPTAQPKVEPAVLQTVEPTALPTAEATALPPPPVAWGDLPVLMGLPVLPADGNIVVINSSPVVFTGPTKPIAVQFRIVDPAGQIAFELQDDDAPWCPLGDSSQGCSVLTLGNGQWINGRPLVAGQHTLQMTAIDALQRASSNQTHFDLNYAWGDLPVLGTTGIAPQGGTSFIVQFNVSPIHFAGAQPSRVTFNVLDPEGNLVFERADGDAPWCAFGDADNASSCKLIRFEKPAWPSGQAMRLGKHILRIQAADGNGNVQDRQVVFNIEFLPREIEPPKPDKPTLPKLTVVAPPQEAAPIEEPIQLKRLRLKGDLEMQLIYPEKARGTLMIYLLARSPGASAIGEGVGKIEFAIFDANGALVNQEQESTPAFCAFGGNDPCNAISLKQGVVWPSTGIPIQTGPYTVQVTVWGKDQNGNLTGPWRGRAKFDVIVPGQN